MRASTLLAVLAGLNLLDYLTTIYLVSHGYNEANPLARKLMELGIYDPVKLSVTYMFLLFGFLAERFEDDYTWMKYPIAALCAVYAFIVVNNVAWIVHSLVHGEAA